MINKIEVGHFCLSNPKESNSYSHIYLAEPGAKFLEKFGRLSVLINLNFHSNIEKPNFSDGKEWSQKLIDFLKDNYYDPLKSAVDVEKDFEGLLGKANAWLSREKARNPDLFEKQLINFDVDVVVIKEMTIHFAQIGNIQTYLIQAGKKSNLSEGKSKAAKFSNIISGTLEEGNILFFTTENIFDYFSPEKIVQMLGQIPANRIVRKFEQLLGEESDRVSMLSLIISAQNEIKAVSQDKTVTKPEKPPKKEKSVPSAKEKVSISSQKKPEKVHPRIKKSPRKSILTVAHQFLVNLKNKSSKTIEKISDQKGEKIKKPLSTETSGSNYFRKSLLIIMIILFLLFATSLIVLSRNEFRARQTRKYAQLVESLREKESDLSIAMIYEEQDTIKNLLNEIGQLLVDFPRVTNEQKESYELFQNKHKQQLNKFYRLVTIDEPELLVDLTEIDKNIKTSGLANIGDDFYIFNANNNYIYLFNIQTKEGQLVNNASANIGHLNKLFPLDNDSLIGFDDNQGIATFNTLDKKLLPTNLEQAHQPGGIKDLIIYSRRLYLLEPDANQIYKYSKTIDGFGKEEAWIDDINVNISDGISMALDGSIYVFKKTGQMVKFYKNKQVEFNLADIHPVLSAGQIKLFSDSDRKYLYLMDRPSQRLIILSKEGKLIKQLTSDKFTDLKDFVINKLEDKAWLLAGTKIFEVDLK